MQKMLHKIGNLTFGLCFAGVCGWIVLRRPEALKQLALSLLATKHPILLTMHFVLLCVVFLLFVVSWHRCIAALGQHCSWRIAAFSWLVPNLGKYLPGKVLMLAGRIELLHINGIRRSICSTALVVEHIAMLVAAAPFCFLALFFGSGAGNMSYLIIGISFTVPALAVALFPHLLVTVVNAILRRFRRVPLQHVPSRRLLLSLIGLYSLLWLTYGLSGNLLLWILFPDLQITPVAAIAAFPAAWMIGFLAIIAPAGLGVREAALVLALGPFMTTNEALSVAIAGRLTWTLVEMLGVAVGWAVRGATSPDVASA